MTVFFGCITLAGCGIVLFAIILLLAEKKRIHDYRQDAAEMENSLIEVIEDAEVLIKEMNKFSDYAVSRLEERNSLLTKLLEEADRRIETLRSLSGAESETLSEKFEETSPQESKDEAYTESSLRSRLFSKKKVIPLDDKRHEIVKLSRSGMDSGEIARLLNMGRGEIELIAKIGK